MITSTHRGHGHCLAKGLDPLGMFAELMGRDSGTNRGRGGSMHIADPTIGIFGANGIVGAGLPIADGAAVAAQLRADGGVAVAFFGDGAVAQGAFHESVNLAAVWRLPVIFWCENNGYAEFSPAETQHAAPLERRAAGYGVGYVAVDGNDVTATSATMSQVVDGVRGGGGPVIVEATTYRWHGHYEGDPQRYRTDSEVDSWKAQDPLIVHAKQLESAGFAGEELQSLEAAVSRELDEAVVTARAAATPAISTLGDFVLRPRPDRPEPPPPPADAPTFRMMDAIRNALEIELATDDDVFVAGIDVGDGGNVFGLTRGLRDTFGDRVRDTPISETAIMGLGVGAAMAGMRPVVELMYFDFVGVCLDQLLNQAAKMPFMTGGSAEMALTVRTQFGAGRSSGSQHSQSLEALLAHIPGLTVVMPSNPADTYGLLRAAIQDPNPVVFIENRLLYGMKGPQPPADHIVPIGKVGRRAGRHGHHAGLGVADGPRGAGGRRSGRRGGDLGRGDRPQDRRSARHGADPRVGAQDEPPADRARGRAPVRHRRRDRGDGRPRGVLGPRRADRAHRRGADAGAVHPRPREGLAARSRRHRRRPAASRRAPEPSSRTGAGIGPRRDRRDRTTPWDAGASTLLGSVGRDISVCGRTTNRGDL